MARLAARLAVALVLACLIVNASATAVGNCWFDSASSVLTGNLTLSQDTTTGVVTIWGSIWTTETSLLSAHLHVYGVSPLGGCHSAVDASFLEFDGTSPDITATTTTALTLTGATSAIGRTIAIYRNTSSCLAALSATPITTCVIGIHSSLATANEAKATLAALPAGATATLYVSSTGTGNVGGGTVYFAPNPANGEVFVYAYVTGLVANSVHGLHIHWYGDMTGTDGLTMGGHLNPQGKYHGTAPSWWRHMGDIGNVTADASGVISHVGSYNLLNFLGDGNIIGRGVVFHAWRDDGNPTNSSTSVGDAGSRWARGVVGISSTRNANLVPAYASCVLSGGTASGTLSLWQTSSSAPVYVSGTVTTGTAGTYSLHSFTYGDLKSGTNQGACFGGDTAVHTFTAEATATVIRGWSSSISLFAAGTNNIIGRSLGLYSSSSCATASAATTLGQCVVGIHSLSALTNTASQVLTSAPTSAYCQLKAGTSGTGITGDVYFTTSATTGEIQVQAWIAGLVANSIHALHVHWYGDMTCEDGVCMGGHLNPYGVNHGASPALWRHMGDIGNTTADANGLIVHSGSYNLLSFTYAAANIIGRGVVFHYQRDDGNPTNSSTSVGDAGSRQARCVIGISARTPTSPWLSSSSTGSSSVMSSSTATTESSSAINAASSFTVSIASLVLAALVAIVAAL